MNFNPAPLCFVGVFLAALWSMFMPNLADAGEIGQSSNQTAQIELIAQHDVIYLGENHDCAEHH